MSEKQAELWTYLYDPAGDGIPKRDSGEPIVDFIDCTGFHAAPGEGGSEAGERYQYQTYGFGCDENAEELHELQFPPRHCPCGSDQTVGRWLNTDPIGFADENGNVFPSPSAGGARSSREGP